MSHYRIVLPEVISGCVMFATILACLPLESLGETKTPSLVVTPYMPGSALDFCGNYSRYEWVVRLDHGVVKTLPRSISHGYEQDDVELPFQVPRGTAREGLAGRRKSAPVTDGWLVSLNAGEFGSGIWWFSRDGTQRKLLGKGAGVGFAKTPAGIFAILGPCGMVCGDGEVIRLDQDDVGEWKVSKFATLGPAAQTFVMESNATLLVVTVESLVRVNLSTRQVETLHRNDGWGGLLPNSVVITDKGELFIGVRHAVAHLVPKDGGYQEEWLVAEDCAGATKETNRERLFNRVR